MLGLWLENQHLTLRHDLEIPQPTEDEALVQVLQAGICNTDLELLRGYYPYRGVLGHEFVGRVVKGPENLQQKRVVGEINASCGNCDYCRRGMTTHCEKRTVLGIVNRNGAFSQYLTLPVRNLHPIPDTITLDAATFTEPIAAALEIQQQIAITPNHRVLVIGEGKLGQLVAQTLALTGCDLTVIGRHPEKLALLSQFGITTGFKEIITPRTFDIAVECTGNPEGFALARQSLRPRGILVLKSTYAGKLTLDASAIVVDELTLMGSRCGPFDQAIALLAEGKIKVESLVQGRYPLEQGLEAFQQAQQKGVLKILLEMAE